MKPTENDFLFSENDPVGTIICVDNPVFCLDSKATPFVDALRELGFTGNWGYLLPPKGEFIDMNKVIDPKIIEQMIDFGMYPHQKQP